MRDGFHWEGSTQQLALKRLFKPWVPDWKLTLTKVPNTEITCRLCRGTKFTYADNGVRIKLQTCPNCHGTGRMKGFDAEQFKPRNN